MTLLGILVPALLASIALRRWYGPLPWSVVGLALLLTLGFLHGAVFTSRIPVPVDEVTRGYPYRGVFGGEAARNALTNDTVKQILPWMQIAREELLHGRIPLWNRHQFSGYPLLANGQSAPFAPLFLATLFVPLPDQLVAMAGLKLFFAIVFLWLLLRQEGVSSPAAFFASAVFTFSVFQTVYLYYPLGTVSAMLPAAAFATLGCTRSAQRRWVVLLALVTATVLASGHPETAVHIGIACALLLVIEWKSPFRALAGALAGAALSAPAWVPVLQQVLLSTRAVTLAAAPHGALHPYVAYLFLNPDAFGNPARGTWQWISNYSVVAPTYFGLIPLALLPGARGRRELALVSCSVLLFFLAMNWSPLARAVNALPPLSLIAQDRLRFVILFFVAIVGAHVLDRSRRVEVLLAGAVLGAAAIWLLHAKWHVTLDWRSAAGVLALGAFLLAFAMNWKRAAPVAFIAIVAELFVFNSSFNALVPRRHYEPRLPILTTLQSLTRGEPSRIVGHDWTLVPNAAAQYGLEDVRGTDPMALASYDRFLSPITVQDPSTDFKRIQDVDAPQLEFLNVRFLISDPELTPGANWTLRYEGPDGKLFERTHWQRRFFSPDGAARIVSIVQPRPTRLEVTIESPPGGASIHSSQVAAPGWRVDGATETFLVHGAFLGFRAAPGRTVVTLTYAPRAFAWSCVISALALAALFAFARSNRGSDDRRAEEQGKR